MIVVSIKNGAAEKALRYPHLCKLGLCLVEVCDGGVLIGGAVRADAGRVGVHGAAAQGTNRSALCGDLLYSNRLRLLLMQFRQLRLVVSWPSWLV